MRNTAGVSPWTPTMKYHLRRHPEGGSPTGSKRHLLRQRYPGGYSQRQYSRARVEGKHRPSGFDPLDRVCRTEPGNHEDGNGTVYTLSLVQPPLPPKGGADKALYSPEVFGVVFQWKANIQGTHKEDSSQS